MQFLTIANFIIVEAFITYNAIINSPLLSTFIKMVLTYGIIVKFSFRWKVIVIRGNLIQSQTYYLKAIGKFSKEYDLL